ncbi:16699_t:CDS:2, partial [Funneliformis geosporum]
MADVSDSLLPFQCKTVDDDSAEEGANNSQDEKGSKVTLYESPMLKKLIEELSTSPGSDEDNSES